MSVQLKSDHAHDGEDQALQTARPAQNAGEGSHHGEGAAECSCDSVRVVGSGGDVEVGEQKSKVLVAEADFGGVVFDAGFDPEGVEEGVEFDAKGSYQEGEAEGGPGEAFMVAEEESETLVERSVPAMQRMARKMAVSTEVTLMTWKVFLEQRP